MDNNFAKQIIFSDKAHFYFSRFVNKKNCKIWGNENSQIMQGYKMHSLRMTMWCGFWEGGVIGSFFFETDVLYVNGRTYCSQVYHM